MKAARRNLRREITNAKFAAWRELLSELDSDPWSRVYRVVVKKLISSGNNAIATMSSDQLDAVIDELFPSGALSDMEHLGPAYLPAFHLVTTKVSATEVRNALRERA